MALRRHTLRHIFISTILLFALCSKTISAHTTTPSHAPAPAPAPAPTEESSSDTPTPSPSPSPSPDAASPISISELIKLSLPEFGVQKASVAPKTEGAKVSNKQLEGIERKIDEFKSTLTKRLADPKTSEASKKCLAQCEENLEDAIDGVKISIESINSQDLSKANVDISGIAADIETCNDCFIEAVGEDTEINAFNEWIKGVTKECLSNL